jgi:hypothetical protein
MVAFYVFIIMVVTFIIIMNYFVFIIIIKFGIDYFVVEVKIFKTINPVFIIMFIILAIANPNPSLVSLMVKIQVELSYDV